MIKTIQIIECRLCGSEYYSGSSPITIKPNEDLEFVTVKQSRCAECKKRNPRTIANPGMKIDDLHSH